MDRLATTFKPFCPALDAYGPIKCNKASFVDAKLDGEYAVWFKNGIFNKNGMERRNFPASEAGKLLAHALVELTGIDFENLQILGELTYGEGKAGDLYRLLSNKLSNDLAFTVFDFWPTDSLLTTMDRRSILVEAFKKAFPITEPSIQIVPFEYCDGKQEIEEAYQKFITEGYEGVVIKPVASLQHIGFKRKATDTSDLKVLSADPWKSRIGLENPLQPGKELCGCKYDGNDKADLVGKIVEIKYLQKLYDKTGKLTGLRNPSFERLRTDKTEASL